MSGQRNVWRSSELAADASARLRALQAASLSCRFQLESGHLPVCVDVLGWDAPAPDTRVWLVAQGLYLILAQSSGAGQPSQNGEGAPGVMT